MKYLVILTLLLTINHSKQIVKKEDYVGILLNVDRPKHMYAIIKHKYTTHKLYVYKYCKRPVLVYSGILVDFTKVILVGGESYYELSSLQKQQFCDTER